MASRLQPREKVSGGEEFPFKICSCRYARRHTFSISLRGGRRKRGLFTSSGPTCRDDPSIFALEGGCSVFLKGVGDAGRQRVLHVSGCPGRCIPPGRFQPALPWPRLPVRRRSRCRCRSARCGYFPESVALLMIPMICGGKTDWRRPTFKRRRTMGPVVFPFGLSWSGFWSSSD